MSSIGELCRRNLYSVHAEQSVREVVRYMAERNIGGVVVLEEPAEGGSRLVGVFSERDLMMRVILPRLDLERTPVARVMTSNPVVVDSGESFESALRVMKQANCRHLPVVSGGRLVGMVSMRDLLEMELADRSHEADQMRSYIDSVPPGSQHR